MQELKKELKSCRMSEPIQGNERQIEAIRFTQGPAMILAGPGSGKTFVTVERICYLITHHHIDPSDILVITFTKAAAREMQERFFRHMGKERPPVRFGTFHAIFYYILRQSAQYRDYTIIKESEQKKILRKILSMHSRFRYVREEDLGTLLKEISKRKSSFAVPWDADHKKQDPPALAEMKPEDFLFLYEEYQACLREFQKMDFEDIGLFCEALLENPERLKYWQSQFVYLLVDEFQDISPLQYRLVKMLAGPQNNLFVVGDDDQSIYGFRGASPRSMKQFQRDYPECQKILLPVNYRCHRDIVQAALAVIADNRERFPKELEASHVDGEGMSLKIFIDREEEQDFLKVALTRQLAGQELSETAFLCRSHYDCLLQCRFLDQIKIPYTMQETAGNPFDHFVIRDLMTYLELAGGCRERNKFLRIMNRPVRYLRRESLQEEMVTKEQWISYYRAVPDMVKELERLFNALTRLSHMTPYLALRYIRNVIGYDRYLKEKYVGEEQTGYLQIAEDFQELARGFSNVRTFSDYISQFKKTAKQKKEEPLPCGVRVMTIHASKGLEFDTVYLPMCEEGHIPSKRATDEQMLEEERRLFYVAMTRARKNLVITAVRSKSGKERPSSFLEPLQTVPGKEKGGRNQSSSSTSSSNSSESRYSSNASATASYSSSSSI